MTNNWTDMGNSTLFVIMGANPTENHPASIAHINIARTELSGGTKTLHDRAGNAYTSSKPKAEMIVIDPRKTRTALQADKYIRIRPGTDIAFINAMVAYITNAAGGNTGLWAAGNENKKTRWEAYHQITAGKSTYTDAGAGNVGKVSPVRPKYTDATFNVGTTDYTRAVHSSGLGSFTNLPTVAGTALDFTGTPDMYGANTAFTALKNHVAPYTLAESASICGCTADEIKYVADKIIANSRCSSVANDAALFAATINDPKLANYRSTTFLYAMGITQHTCGSQNVKSFAVIQTLMGNMGRAGGGINALRGIHNVQGSTDMGLLYHLIPGYSGNPTGTFGSYMDALYGNRINGAAGSGDADPYVFANSGLQQKGFWSMTKSFFGDTSYRASTTGATITTWGAYPETASVLPEDEVTMNALYALWPKGNGDNHVKMFRKMQPLYVAADKIKAAVVWGQNPAITEPNQGSVRDGLKELDLLVCVDMFENETASCDRKAGGVTYLIPACSHVEEAGSATNSGRVLQWREQALLPQGNSLTDVELLMRFAYALNGAGAFDHISTAWTALNAAYSGWDVYEKTWGSQYGWTPGDTFDSEVSALKCYKQMCAPQNNGGALWIYLNGWDTTTSGNGGGWPADPVRAKSRIGVDADSAGGGHLLYKNWGYAWLINRRVLYNNGDVPGDVPDGFQGPDLVARLFVSTYSSVVNYSTAYRKVHTMADKPYLPNGTSPAGAALAGRFPWHTEPYESPRPDVADKYGYNSSLSTAVNPTIGPRNCTFNGTDGISATPIGDVATYPLVLTSIRCVEHFQGGPITRNNHWNVELSPEPWVELNSVDARTFGIKDGDMVKIVTARTADFAGDTIEADFPRAEYGDGFRAKVGVGLEGNQRVGEGVVAIPWHWGERGLSTGSRANDLCIDAMDANTTIPESKACLCRIEKI